MLPSFGLPNKCTEGNWQKRIRARQSGLVGKLEEPAAMGSAFPGCVCLAVSRMPLTRIALLEFTAEGETHGKLEGISVNSLGIEKTEDEFGK